jgi:hypothetical protein
MDTKPSHTVLYRQLIKRHQQIEKEMDKLMTIKIKNGFKIIALVSNHAEVRALHQSR